MIAIGLDPSLTGFGWSVLFERAVLACGVFRTEKGEGKVADDNALRFDFIARGLVEVLDNQYAVGEPVLFVEAVALPHGRAPAKTALAQGRARGLVDGIAAARRLRLVEVPTHTVKAIVPTFKRRKALHGGISSDHHRVIGKFNAPCRQRRRRRRFGLLRRLTTSCKRREYEA